VSDMYVVGMILNGKGAMGFVNVRSGRLWDAVKERDIRMKPMRETTFQTGFCLELL